MAARVFTQKLADNLLLSDQLHPPIAGSSLWSVIGLFGLGRSKSPGIQARGVNVILRDQGLLDGDGTAVGEVEIIGVATDVVGVAVDVEFPGRVISSGREAISSRTGRRFWPELIAGKVKVDAIDIDMSLLLQCLLD